MKVDGEGEVLPFSDEVFQKDLAEALRMVEGGKYIDRRNYRKKARKIRNEGEIIVDSERLKTLQDKLVELEQELGSDDKGAVESKIKHIFTLAENSMNSKRLWLVYLYRSLKGYEGYELYFHNLFKEPEIEFAILQRYDELYALYELLQLKDMKGWWFDNLGGAIGASGATLKRLVDEGVISEEIYNTIEEKLDKSSEAKKDESSKAGKLTPGQKENFLNWLESHIVQRKKHEKSKNDAFEEATSALAEPNWQQSITEMINTASELTSQSNRTKENELGKIYSALLIAAREANDDKKQQIKELMGNEHFIEKIVRRAHLYALLTDLKLPAEGSRLKNLGEAIGVSGNTLIGFIKKGEIGASSYNKIKEKLDKLSAAGKLTPEQKENFLNWLASHIEQRKKPEKRKNDAFEEVTLALAEPNWQQSITEMINTASELTSQNNRTKENELGKIYGALLLAAREANDDKKTADKKLMGNKHFIEEIVRRAHLYALLTDLKFPAEGSRLKNLGEAIGVSGNTLIGFIKKGEIGASSYNKIKEKLDKLSAAGKLTPKQKENFLNWLASHIEQRKKPEKSKNDAFEEVTLALAEPNWQQSITEMINTASELTSQNNRTKENELGKIYGALLLAAREANDDKKQQIKKLMGNKHFIEEIVRRGHLYALPTDLKFPAEGSRLKNLGEAIGVIGNNTLIEFIKKGEISEGIYNKIKGELDKLSAAGKLTPEQKENFLNWLASHISQRKKYEKRKNDAFEEVTLALAEPNWQQSITEMINTASELTSQSNRTKENELGKIYSALLLAVREANDDKKQQIKELMGNKHFTEKIVRRGHLYSLLTDLKLSAEGRWLISLGEAIGVSDETLKKFFKKGEISEGIYNKIKGELDKLSAAEKDKSEPERIRLQEQKENFLNWLASHKK